jgi:hypothetical protein
MLVTRSRGETYQGGSGDHVQRPSASMDALGGSGAAGRDFVVRFMTTSLRGGSDCPRERRDRTPA